MILRFPDPNRVGRHNEPHLKHLSDSCIFHLLQDPNVSASLLSLCILDPLPLAFSALNDTSLPFVSFFIPESPPFLQLPGPRSCPFHKTCKFRNGVVGTPASIMQNWDSSLSLPSVHPSTPRAPRTSPNQAQMMLTDNVGGSPESPPL